MKYIIFGGDGFCSLIFEYVETFYNTRRIHSHCNYASPDDYEKAYKNHQKNVLQAVS